MPSSRTSQAIFLALVTTVLALPVVERGARVADDDTDIGYVDLFSTVAEEAEQVPLEWSKGKPPPAWLNGAFYQVGPGKFEHGGQQFTHAFDGYGKVTAFHFEQGAVRFSTKFVRTKFLNDSLACNCIAGGILAQETVPPRQESMMANMKAGNDNNNVNVFLIDETLLLLSDTSKVVAVDFQTLHPKGDFVPASMKGLPHACILLSLHTPSSFR